MNYLRKIIFLTVLAAYVSVSYAVLVNFNIPVCVVNAETIYRMDGNETKAPPKLKWMYRRHLPMVKSVSVPIADCAVPFIYHTPDVEYVCMTHSVSFTFITAFYYSISARAPPQA
ncbi:hypothetical protein K1X84_09170 [bacterium]|nr:hypothetical protein [bacterium]